jgi:hypothetical protein
VPAERFEIRTELTEQGESDITLALRVYAKTSDEATDEAEHLFRKIRAAADLSSGGGSARKAAVAPARKRRTTKFWKTAALPSR